MKTCKKLLAVLLSVLLLASAVVIPVAAEEEPELVTRYISLLDLSKIDVGTSVTGGGLVRGLDHLKYSTLNGYNNISHSIKDKQEVVAVDDPDDLDGKGLDLTLNSPGKNANLYDIPNEFAVQVPIPGFYVEYLESISLKLDAYNKDSTVKYRFGVSTPSYSIQRYATPGNWEDANINKSDDLPNSVNFTHVLTNTYKVPNSKVFGKYDTTDKWTKEDTLDITHAFLIIAKASEQETQEHITIKDFGITIKATQEELDAIPESADQQVFDFSDIPEGELTTYPEGVVEERYRGGRELYPAEAKSVVTNEEGKKVFKLDCTKTPITYTSSGNRFEEHKFSRVHSMKIDIPANHVKLVRSISITFNKQTTGKLVYNFGVTDGTMYSKHTDSNNASIAAGEATMGKTTITLIPYNLYRYDNYAAGAYKQKGETWGDKDYEFTKLFLLLTVIPSASGETPDGYVTIDEISYDCSATKAKTEQYKGFISGFESTNTGEETDAAIKGSYAWRIHSINGYNTRIFDITRNTNIAEATGLSFWINNPNDVSSSYKICLKERTDEEGNRASYVFANAFSVPAHTSRKVVIDFSDIGIDKNPGDAGGWTQGDKISLTPEQIANLQLITIMDRTKSTDTFVDEMWLTFDGPLATGKNVTVAATDTNKGRAYADNGKVLPGQLTGVNFIPVDGNMIKRISVTDSLGNEIPLIKNTEYKLDYYYNFVMPDSDVNIVAEFATITGSLTYETKYVDGNDVQIDFSIPLKGGKAFNYADSQYQTLGSYGLYITSEPALLKYGIDPEDLTLEMVRNFKETGHHLANYIWLLDDTTVINVTTGPTYMSFTVKITDVSINARRNTLIMGRFATFTDENANPYSSITTRSIDSMVYGDDFVSDYMAYMGINYSDVLNGIATVSTNNKVFNVETWKDIKAQGFDSVRLPVNLDNSIDENGNLIEAHMSKLDTVVKNASAAGLSLVISLNGFADVAENNEKFLNVWEQLATRYADAPLSVAFELLDAPALPYADLVDLQLAAINTIRSIEGNEERRIIVTTTDGSINNINDISEAILAIDNVIFSVNFELADATDYDANEILDYMFALDGIRASATGYNFDVMVGAWGTATEDATAKLNYLADVFNAADSCWVAQFISEYDAAYGPNPNGEWNADILAAIGLG